MSLPLSAHSVNLVMDELENTIIQDVRTIPNPGAQNLYQ